tara:strand:+ start:962 stop:1270 length:309 start_codon:yes stop_codon:yes gene_type:complete
MNITKYFCAVAIFISPVILASPKITISFGDSNGFAQVKIKNETFEPLACYVAIDGHRIKFQLQVKSSSPWISATDKQFNYQNFSTWCDYLEIHPKYKSYQIY